MRPSRAVSYAVLAILVPAITAFPVASAGSPAFAALTATRTAPRPT